MTARVIVTLRADIPDSHGETVAQAIVDAGYDSVTSVRQGKLFDVEIEADDRAAAHSMLVKIWRDVLADLESEDFLVRVGVDRREGGERRGGGERRAGDDRRDQETQYDGSERRTGARRAEERRSDDE